MQYATPYQDAGERRLPCVLTAITLVVAFPLPGATHYRAAVRRVAYCIAQLQRVCGLRVVGRAERCSFSSPRMVKSCRAPPAACVGHLLIGLERDPNGKESARMLRQGAYFFASGKRKPPPVTNKPSAIKSRRHPHCVRSMLIRCVPVVGGALLSQCHK